MFRLYDKAFKTGFVLTIFAFVAINIAYYIIAARKFAEYLSEPIRFAPYPTFPPWGFPFVWRGHSFGYIGGGLVLNFIIVVGCGFIVGLLFRSLNLQLGRRNR